MGVRESEEEKMPIQNRNINPSKWLEQFGFSHAVETTGHTRVLRCSGQTSVNANGEPQHEGNLAAQVTLALDNLEAVLKEAGMSLSNVVQLNMYTTDMDKFFEGYMEITQRLGKAGVQPASTLLGVARLAFPPLMIELEATAVA
jgi:enamine deaminase RidA (YjgF/YER057c/UK114 family)